MNINTFIILSLMLLNFSLYPMRESDTNKICISITNNTDLGIFFSYSPHNKRHVKSCFVAPQYKKFLFLAPMCYDLQAKTDTQLLSTPLFFCTFTEERDLFINMARPQSEHLAHYLPSLIIEMAALGHIKRERTLSQLCLPVISTSTHTH